MAFKTSFLALNDVVLQYGYPICEMNAHPEMNAHQKQ